MVAGTAFLTFVVTVILMTALYLWDGERRQRMANKRVIRENEDLRRQLSEFRQREQRGRETAAYNQGLYDGRTTDTYYRQCLKKFTSREQAEIMMNGDEKNE